ncbi:MAG: hypothetical protein N4A63_12900 [Vallitalea sp.]|jgi:hypothetical protein|nr:hypothetical protein [Vallitalea sp.]
MGMPEIFINFKAKSSNFIRQSARGIVCVLIKETTNVGITHCISETEIPGNITEKNKSFCKMAFNINRPPSEVIIVAYSDKTKISSILETISFNYCCTNVSNDTDHIATIIKDMRDTKKIKVKAVLYNSKSDHEGIINFTDSTKGINYTSRITSIIATTPLDKSVTYFVLNDIETKDIQMLSKADMDIRVNNGELFIVNDGVKCKLSRGVNSLVTTNEVKTEDFKTIKIIDIMDKIDHDIRTTVADNYTGTGNNYNNKMNLVVAIRQYLEDLQNQGIVGKFNVELDLEAQIKYIKTLGAKIDEMTETEIKHYNTRKKVFIIINVQLIDAMEDFYFSVNLM